MFEGIERELQRLSVPFEVPVDLPLDQDGFLDRRCPEARCHQDFRVFFADWRDKVSDAAFCPLCGMKAEPMCWNTPRQDGYIQEIAVKATAERVSRAIERGVAQGNRRPAQGGFLRMTMEFKPGPNLPVSPPRLTDLIESKMRCPSCACRYAIVGAAFFCVACGHHDPDTVLNSSLEAIRRTMDSLPEILKSITDPDTAAMAERSWIENSLINVVSSFESWAQHLHSRLASSPATPRGSFQSLVKGSDSWESLTGRSLREHLTIDEWPVLLRAFQRRHLFVHRQGIVDAEYTKRSGDETWAEGRRIVLIARDILEYVRIVEKLAKGMRVDAVEALSSRN